jgi:hypothetical protein
LRIIPSYLSITSWRNAFFLAFMKSPRRVRRFRKQTKRLFLAILNIWNKCPKARKRQMANVNRSVRIRQCRCNRISFWILYHKIILDSEINSERAAK